MERKEHHERMEQKEKKRRERKQNIQLSWESIHFSFLIYARFPLLWREFQTNTESTHTHKTIAKQ